MKYLLWSLLNLALLGYFLYMVYGLFSKGRKIFQHRLKPVSIIIMMLGLAQVLDRGDDFEPNNKKVFVENYEGNGGIKLAGLAMDDGLSLNFFLSAKFAYEDDELIVLETNSDLSGLTFGYTWNASKIVRLMESDVRGQPRYRVIGYLTWQLFGFDIYSEEKDFSGTIPRNQIF